MTTAMRISDRSARPLREAIGACSEAIGPAGSSQDAVVVAAASAACHVLGVALDRVPLPWPLFVRARRIAAEHPAATRAMVRSISAVGCSDPSTHFHLGAMYEESLADDGTRRRRGSFYTPLGLIDHVLDGALSPTIAESVREGKSPTDLTICDPACGTGRFLVRAAQRLARAGVPIEYAVRAQIFGVDLDPIAVDFARLALWSLCPGAQPDLAEASVRTGDAVLGTIDGSEAQEGIPSEAYRPRKGENAEIARELRRRLRAEARAHGDAHRGAGDVDLDAWCAAFFWSECAPGEIVTPALLREIRESGSCPDSVALCVKRHGFFHWGRAFGPVRTGGFDVVIGNPPFKSQLSSQTSNAAGAARLMKHWSGGRVSGYVDLAGAFVCRAFRLVRTGGRIGFVLPRSMLTAAHGGAVRAATADAAAVESLWVSEGQSFTGASVETVAVTLRRGGGQGEIRRARGSGFVPCAPIAASDARISGPGSWAPLAARPGAVPEITFGSGGVIEEIAEATADFRDEYYGLRGVILEDAEAHGVARAPLVTSGLIDLAQSLWGSRSARVHKRRWVAPCVALDLLEGDAVMAKWVRARRVPKVIVAVQTRAMEAWVDELGGVLPGLPLISVVPREPARIWEVGAAVASPVATLVAVRTAAGAALSRDAIKLSARQVRSLPVPVDSAAWSCGADLFRQAHGATSDAVRRSLLTGFAEAMVRAHGVVGGDADVLVRWWCARAFSD